MPALVPLQAPPGFLGYSPDFLPYTDTSHSLVLAPEYDHAAITTTTTRTTTIDSQTQEFGSPNGQPRSGSVSSSVTINTIEGENPVQDRDSLTPLRSPKVLKWDETEEENNAVDKQDRQTGPKNVDGKTIMRSLSSMGGTQ